MFLQPANKLSISGRVKQAAQASGEVRSRVSAARACTFQDKVIFV